MSQALIVFERSKEFATSALITAAATRSRDVAHSRPEESCASISSSTEPAHVIPKRPLGYELLEVGVFGDDSASAGIIKRELFQRLHVVVVILQNEKPIPASKQMLVKTR